MLSNNTVYNSFISVASLSYSFLDIHLTIVLKVRAYISNTILNIDKVMEVVKFIIDLSENVLQL